MEQPLDPDHLHERGETAALQQGLDRGEFRGRPRPRRRGRARGRRGWRPGSISHGASVVRHVRQAQSPRDGPESKVRVQKVAQHRRAVRAEEFQDTQLRGHLRGCSHAGPAAPPGLTHRREVPQHVQAVHGELEERGEGVEEAEADEPSAVVRGSGGDDARVEQGESRGALEGVRSVGADLCARRPER